MHPGFQRRLRPIAAFILVFFSWFCIEPWNYAVAAPPPKAAPKDKGASEKLEEALHAVKSLTQGLDPELAADREIQPKVDQLIQHQKNIAALDTAVQKEFADTEAFLKARNLPAVILDRHTKAVSEFKQNMKTLRGHLDEMVRLHGEGKRAKGKGDLKSADQKKGELREKLKVARAHLEEKVKEPPHQKLDPNNLPHRMPKVKERLPRLKKEEFAEFQKPVQLAFNGDPSFMLVQSTQDLPTPADLAENIEVQFTPEIQALATELAHNPVKIYNWVHNNIDFVPTYGSIQGANHCLATKQCNDMDTASLLIALLRVSGISARYVYGTIEVPIAQAMNWVGGFTDPVSAANFIVSGGTPVTTIIRDGQVSAIRMEHVWIEAYVDYIPSRGAVHKQGDTWVPIDASFKQYLYVDGIDLNPFIGTDARALVDQVTQGAILDTNTGSVTSVNSLPFQTTLENGRSNLVNYAQSNLIGQTVKDVFGGQKVIQQNPRILPNTLANKIVMRATSFSEVIDNLRQKLMIEFLEINDIQTDFSVTKSLPELSGQRITLSYDPESASDLSVITNAATSGAVIIPAYLVKLVPKLRLENVDLATGSPIGMGNSVQLKLTFIDPAGVADSLNYDMSAGDFSVIGLSPALSSGQLLSSRVSRLQQVKVSLENQTLGSYTKEDLIGEMLNIAMLTYWSESDLAARLDSIKSKVVVTRMPSVGTNSSTLLVSKLFGVPFSASQGGLAVDIKRDAVVVKSINGNKNAEIAFMFRSGVLGSSLEGNVYAQIFKQPGMGISASDLLALANNSGVPLYKITSQNAGTVLPRLHLDSDVISDIQDAIASGKIAIVPEQNLTLNGWSGTGYIIFDPNSGGGAYLISGGLAGGLFKSIVWGGLFLAGFSAALILAPVTLGGTLALAAGFAVLGAFVATALENTFGVKADDPLSPDKLNAAAFNMIVQFILGEFMNALVTAAGGAEVAGSLAFFLGPEMLPIVLTIVLAITVMILIDQLANQALIYRKKKYMLARLEGNSA